MDARRGAAAAVLLCLLLTVSVTAVSPGGRKEIDQGAFHPVHLRTDRSPGDVEDVRSPASPGADLSVLRRDPELSLPRLSSLLLRRLPARHPAIAVPKAAVRPALRGHAVRGAPTYYCRAGISRCTRGYPDGPGKDFYAAAGPSLRIGDWRGRTVTVTANGRSIEVTLIDWCACRSPHFLDLYWDAFEALGRPRTAIVRW